MNFSFQKHPVPPEAPASALNVGTWKNHPLMMIGKELYAYNPKLTKLDPYEVSAEIYITLKEKFGWTHAEAADVFKTSIRTAEGMPQGRISVRTRKALCHIAAGISG